MRKNKHWTNEEDEQLVYLTESGYTAKEVSQRLGRTPSSISTRRHIVGTYRIRPWSVEEEEYLVGMTADGGLTVVEAVNDIDRTIGAGYQRLHRIKETGRYETLLESWRAG